MQNKSLRSVLLVFSVAFSLVLCASAKAALFAFEGLGSGSLDYMSPFQSTGMPRGGWSVGWPASSAFEDHLLLRVRRNILDEKFDSQSQALHRNNLNNLATTISGTTWVCFFRNMQSLVNPELPRVTKVRGASFRSYSVIGWERPSPK